jgi:hypothetical protein
MDNAALAQRELFSKFMLAYGRVERETDRVDKLIPSAEKLADREKTKMVSTMSGVRKRSIRGVIEEQLSEVEGILDHLGSLSENIDEASEVSKMLAEAEPVEGAEEIDISELENSDQVG